MDELLVTAAHDRLLTAARFQQLADVPPEIEWFAANKSSRRAYENALQDFMGFMGVARLAGVNCLVRRVASRSNVIRRCTARATAARMNSPAAAQAPLRFPG